MNKVTNYSSILSLFYLLNRFNWFHSGFSVRILQLQVEDWIEKKKNLKEARRGLEWTEMKGRRGRRSRRGVGWKRGQIESEEACLITGEKVFFSWLFSLFLFRSRFRIDGSNRTEHAELKFFTCNAMSEDINHDWSHANSILIIPW
jgi:hypothetical protein